MKQEIICPLCQKVLPQASPDGTTPVGGCMNNPKSSKKTACKVKEKSSGSATNK